MRILTTALLLVCGAATHANEMFHHDLHAHLEREDSTVGTAATATGKVFDVNVLVRATASGSPQHLTSFSVDFGELRFSITDPALSQVVEPRLTEMYVISDTGVYGEHYSIELPFGPKTRCLYGSKVHRWRASFEVHFNDGKVDGYKIYSACRD